MVGVEVIWGPNSDGSSVNSLIRRAERVLFMAGGVAKAGNQYVEREVITV
jgi:hypothetical protein